MRRTVAYAGGVAGALALASVHWLGLLVGGVVVGLFASTWLRALTGGALFGAVTWVAFVALLADAGRLAGYFDAGRLLALSVAMPLILGLVGGLAYGLRSGERTA
jgi:hypothetical protein